MVLISYVVLALPKFYNPNMIRNYMIRNSRKQSTNVMSKLPHQ